MRRNISNISLIWRRNRLEEFNLEGYIHQLSDRHQSMLIKSQRNVFENTPSNNVLWRNQIQGGESSWYSITILLMLNLWAFQMQMLSVQDVWCITFIGWIKIDIQMLNSQDCGRVATSPSTNILRLNGLIYQLVRNNQRNTQSRYNI